MPALVAGMLCLATAQAGEQPSSASTGTTLSQIHPYPSGLTINYTHVNNSPVNIAMANRTTFAGTTAGAPTSSATFYNPVPLNTNSLNMLLALGSNVTIWEGAYSGTTGTFTITFSRPVTNPRLHLNGLAGGASAGANDFFGMVFALATPGLTMSVIQGALAAVVPPKPPFGGTAPTQQTIRAVAGSTNCNSFSSDEWCGTVH